MVPKRAIFKIFIIIVIITAALYLCFQLLGRIIYDMRTCDRFNIDNIELHTQTNIPSVNNYYCDYNPTLNIKKSLFDINMKEVDIDQYIQRQHFKTVKDKLFLDHFKTFQTDSYFKDLSELYFKKDNYKRADWKMLLNKSTGRLWVILKYND